MVLFGSIATAQFSRSHMFCTQGMPSLNPSTSPVHISLDGHAESPPDSLVGIHCECSHLIIYFLINPEYNLKAYFHPSFSFIWVCHRQFARHSTFQSNTFPTTFPFPHSLPHT